MSPPSPPEPRALFFLRRGDGRVSGPHDKSAIVKMLGAGELDGGEQIAIDRRSWKPLGLLIGPAAPQTPARPPAPPEEAAAVARPSFIDLPLGVELTLDAPASKSPPRAAMKPPSPDDEPPRDARRASPASRGEPTAAVGGRPVGDDGAPGVELSLELVERNPAPRAAPVASPPVVAHRVDLSAAPESPASPAPSPSGVPPVGDGPQQADPTLPVSIERATTHRKATRPRTVTAARGGPPTADDPGRNRLRRLVVAGAIVAALGATAAAAILLDLPARLRPEPRVASVLGALADQLARDRFPVYAAAARALEDAVANRREAPAIRAEAALLLASSVVIHGADRGRLAHAEALLPLDDAHGSAQTAARTSVARARAWVALGRMRLKEATALAGDSALPMLAAGDRAMIRGWAALGRQDEAAAEAAFVEAERAAPAAAPSTVAARFGLALAREGVLSARTAETFRAILADSPDHVGAALGLMRTLPLGAAGRLKLAQGLIAARAAEASRAELAEAHARAAEAFEELGDVAAAEAARARARQADPTSPALAVLLGDEALAEGRRDDAFASYKGTLAAPLATPRTAAFQFARVGALLDAGRFEEVAKSLGRLEPSLPRDPRAPFWRGQLAERHQPPDPEAAGRSYEEALKRNPRFVPASLDLARLRLGQHRAADALAVLKRAEGQGATPVALHVALGEALLASGSPTEAVRVFRQAVTEDKRSVAARLGFANALYGSGSADEAATEVAALAARADVATLGPRAGDRIAELLVKLGRRDEALALYEKEIGAGRGSPSTKVAASRLALDRGRLDVAQKLAAEAAAEDPRTPGALLVLGEALQKRGDLAGAIAELRRAQAIDGAPEVQLEYGRVLASMGRDEEAMAALAEAGEVPQAGVERGRIDLRRGNFEKAVEELSAATARLPTDADAFLLLGQAADRLGHGGEAEAAFKTTTRLAPSSGEAHYRLGRLLLDRGAVAAALPHLRAAVEHLQPAATWRADAYFQLGFAEQRQGSRERAVVAFRRYLELAPGDAPARAEVLKQLGEGAP